MRVFFPICVNKRKRTTTPVSGGVQVDSLAPSCHSVLAPSGACYQQVCSAGYSPQNSPRVPSLPEREGEKTNAGFRTGACSTGEEYPSCVLRLLGRERETGTMLMHPMQQSPIVAAGPAQRKSLERDHRRIDLIFADEAPTSSSTSPAPAPRPAEDEIAGKMGQWCERNSVALLEACCNRDVVKGACRGGVSAQLRSPLLTSRVCMYVVVHLSFNPGFILSDVPVGGVEVTALLGVNDNGEVTGRHTKLRWYGRASPHVFPSLRWSNHLNNC